VTQRHLRIADPRRDHDRWLALVRTALAGRLPPDRIVWHDTRDADGTGSLFGDVEGAALEPDDSAAAGSAGTIPSAWIDLSRVVSCHRHPDRYARLHRVLWRMRLGDEPGLLSIATDDDVRRLEQWRKAVRRDVHKMKAFVRFRRARDDDGEERYIAWHRPDHPILRLAAPFFARRFAVMRWTILTPDESADWDGQRLRFGPGVPRSEPSSGDDVEDLWRTYYRSIFNPARVKVRAMIAEMPVRHWATLPEAADIEDLLRAAPARMREMIDQQAASARTALDEMPDPGSDGRYRLPVLAEAAATCTACDLCASATRTVFGEGPDEASIMLVGEQPGDEEDRSGRPFTGPARRLLDAALEEAGLDRRRLYVTNAVKHFRFVERGKRRIHARPKVRHVRACRPGLEAEIGVVRPHTLVLLGATATRSLLGPEARIDRLRGRVLRETRWAPGVFVTTHPASILRLGDEGPAAERAIAGLVDDLRRAGAWATSDSDGASRLVEPGSRARRSAW